MRKYLSLALILGLSVTTTGAQDKKIEKKIDSVLKLMTLNEKIGQLNQYTNQ
ncbi:hypothetical protein G7074_21425 [Pedobacter sp. HDW13]|uniref:hypothetical protein n=1 Tax=unclassified Pedobacter TaxID=2628915 RepID=UPI00131A0769|nr:MULTISPECIES: hypothetical protein [unclassified Pedobacter]QIL37809.1 hypothetical protein G7074_21425 [Pedobacter sp. HDW13]